MKNDVLSRYANALDKIDQGEGDPTERQIIDVLTARDALQAALIKEEGTENFGSMIAETTALDKRLGAAGELIAAKVDLAGLRAGHRPEDDAWWWRFEPARKVSAWDRLDWLWNSVMAGALALTASFMMQIFQALSVGGLSWGETFATIAQGGGLALIGSGALTDTGKKRVEQIIWSLGIPGKYQAEVTCLFSLLVLATVYWVHSSLPDYYYNKGHGFYEQSNLTDAQLKLQQGLRINPEDARFNLALGQVYESMGNLDAALAEYKVIAETGDPYGLNNIGRVFLFRVDPLQLVTKPTLAEAYLRMGLQRAEVRGDDPNLLYQLNRNLGWALLYQKRYEEAEQYLSKAVALDKTITHDQIGGGMAYCLLGHAYQEMNNSALAEENWQACLENARPETVFEYKWFMDVKHGKDADHIFTTSIVSGMTEEQFQAFLENRVASAGKPGRSDGAL